MAALLTPEAAFHAAFALVFLVAAAAVVAVRMELGLLLVAAAMAVTLNLRYSAGGGRRSLAVDLGGLSIGLLDVLAALMLVIAAFRTIRRVSIRSWETVPWLLLVLVCGNAVRGGREFPTQEVVNELRPWLYLIATVLFASLVPRVRAGRRLLVGGLVLYTAWLVGVAIAGFATTGVRTVTDMAYADGRLVDPRPVAASGGLVLAEVLLLTAGCRGFFRRGWWWATLAVLGLLVVLLQHRTVWVAAIVAIAYLLAEAVRRGGRARRIAIPVLAAGGVATFVIAVTGALRHTALAASTDNAFSQGNTLSWRILGWQELLGERRSFGDQLLGEPFGGGFERVVDGVTLTVSAHSEYVATVLRLGLVGLLAVGFLLLVAWRSADAAGVALGIPPRFLRAVLILVILYGTTYSWDPMQGVVLGLLVGFTKRRPEPERVPAGRVPTPSSSREPALAPSTPVR